MEQTHTTSISKSCSDVCYSRRLKREPDVATCASCCLVARLPQGDLRGFAELPIHATCFAQIEQNLLLDGVKIDVELAKYIKRRDRRD